MGRAFRRPRRQVSVCSVYVTFADAEQAVRIGRAMIEQRLAACINILGPCASIYRWEGAVEEANEVAALFKTTLARTDALIAAVTALHSYEVPAVAVWPIERLPADYANWVEQSVTG